MITVGVTGKYCAGKSTVVEILETFGFSQIDVDALGYAALESESSRVVAHFGDRVCGSDGLIDRKALGSIVFANRDALRVLEHIIHPQMVQMTKQRIEQTRTRPDGVRGIVINAAVLFRMNLDRLCDLIVFVDAPFLMRVRRARLRDGSHLIQTLRRFASQRDVDPQYSHPDADIHSVVNDGSREELIAKLRSILSLPEA